MRLRRPAALSPIWPGVMKASLVGNAVLLVLLGGGSHAHDNNPNFPVIYPHRPVHLAEDFDFLIGARYNELLRDATIAWTVAIDWTNPIAWTGPLDTQEIDALFIDLAEGGQKQIEYTNHNGDTPSFLFIFDCPCPGYARVYPIHVDDALGEPFKLGVFNATAGLMAASDDANVERWFTHESGHLLSLKDHDNVQNPGAYTGMMDGTCNLNACDDPADYEILNFTLDLFPDLPLLELFPDEASCVRLLFEIPGKQLCEDIN